MNVNKHLASTHPPRSIAALRAILAELQADCRYQENLDWGEPRSGHPEGSIRQHLDELQRNLDQLRPRVSDGHYWKLRILIHVHDSFKPDAKPGVSIEDPRSHASLARAFLAEYCVDADLLAMVQYHDEPYALWRKSGGAGCDEKRLARLIERIDDWDLYSAFLIIDGCAEGKSREPLVWFFRQIAGRVDTKFGTEDIL
ncbi:hypothetical protein Pan216_05030 [Planctomycetes bacterium Pan216]|uniref:HD domain-containing protein n=1 Tax=Kolteria novifilia TaxID=2527975 RepID=A0A518AY69_9BACT|nr:hypothetical protein Pan216_05030 [Planctomycetes bacterium Pan216]